MKTMLLLLALMQSATSKIEGRLMDGECGIIGGIPWKVVHKGSCIVDPRVPPKNMWVLIGGGVILELKGQQLQDALKLRKYLDNGKEMYVVIENGRLKELK